jgi:amino acid adenylation domain-containing protein
MNKQKIYEELLKKRGIQAPKGPVLMRRDDPGPFQLSFAQRRIWFLQQFDRESAAYNDPTALRLKGRLDISLLEQTFNEIIRRHGVLRMNFRSREGKPLQILNQDGRMSISVTTLENDPGKLVDADEQIREFVNRFSRQPFDLSRDLLIRAALLKIGEGDYALVVNKHHIVVDGWSKGIMLEELKALYRAYSEGKPSPLPGLAVQYSDYVHWLHEWMQGKLYERQSAYWKKQLAGAPPILELAADHPRPNIPSGGGSLEPFGISRHTFQELQALAQQEDVTLFMLLAAAYAVLLFRYSYPRQEDLVIGTPAAGRNRLELENLIGLFVNTLVLRLDVSRDPTFKTLLGRVRTTALEAYDHQDMPFEKLVEELNPQRNLSVGPIFQVMFQLQNAPMPPAEISGLTISPIQIDTGFSQVDLSLTLWEEGGTLRGTMEYNTDLFESAAIRRMIRHYKTILEAAGEGVNRPVTRMSMLSPEEMRQLLIEWNNTAAEYPGDLCIYQLFASCVQGHPGENAVIFRDRQMAYRELERAANRTARYLEKLGIGPETPVGICLDNSLELITGIMGILKAGGAYIPLDPAYPGRRLTVILGDARPPVLLTQESYLHRFSGYGGRIICLDSDAERERIAGESAGSEANRCRSANAACIIYTSGSTGEPKGILIENRSIVNLIYSFIFSYGPGPGDRILPLTSIASASFVGEILPILTSGAAVVLADKAHFLDMKKLAVLLSENRITILSTVPSLLARLNALAAETWKPGKLRLLLSGGEALSPGDIDRLIRWVTVVNGYGLTEATICSTYIVLNKKDTDFSKQKQPVISVGGPIINTQVYILDRQMGPVPIGVPGEIYIGGDGLTRGYLNNPEMTNEKLLRGVQGGSFLEKSPPGRRRLFRTGDLGAWQADGKIKFLGRIDTQVQIHGYRIELAEIETCLGLHPDIRDVVVIDRELVPGDRRLVAYLAGENTHKLTGSHLREWLGRRVPEYMIPAVFEMVDNIPLNPNGKVDIDALPVPALGRPELDVDYKAPQSPLEKQIAAVWKEFLLLERVGIDDNFFDLGGHSLLLTQVHSRLSEMHKDKKELTIVDMFRHPTIYTLAKYIGEDDSRQLSRAYQKVRERGNRQRQVFNRREFKPRVKLS